MTRVLVVDDVREMCDVIVEDLVRRGLDAVAQTSADSAFALLSSEPFDVVVTDLNMRGMSGLELCHRVVANRPDIPVVVVTAFGSMDTAVATLRAGAHDFLTKPFEMEELALSIERAISHRDLREEVRRLRAVSSGADRTGEIVGASAAIQRTIELIERVAVSDATVLITGETGTGKELVARAIHRRSAYASGPLVTINCAALPENLLDAELFGHVRGAYTDARENRKGLLVEAHGGTIFLDEIGEMPLAMQAKLLRALEARMVRPIGGNAEVPFSARLVAATNRDLSRAVDDGTFREDLYYRINVVNVETPPLRARGTDVLLLAQSFLAARAAQDQKPALRLSPEVAERLLDYSWPGNVRELKNCIERAIALARHEQLIVEDLPAHIRNYSPAQPVVPVVPEADLVSLAEVERRHILRVLEAANGNKREAARILGLDRATLYRKLDRYSQGTRKD